MASTLRVLVLVAGLAVICGGCGRVDVNKTPISADDGADFSRWQRSSLSELPPDVQQEFQGALQQLRFVITAKGEASGHDAIEAALAKRVNGHTVNEVLRWGYETRLERLEFDRVQLQRVISTNARLITKPGDLSAAETLEGNRAMQQKRFDKTIAEIKDVEARLVAVGGTVPPKLADQQALVSPDQATREDALKEIATLIEERRAPGRLKYGDWPVKIDRTGAQLDETERAPFLEKQAAAKTAGRVVVPIKIKGRWLFFDSANRVPDLPKFMLAKLTPEDVRKFTDDWTDVEAERWAREQAADFEVPQK